MSAGDAWFLGMLSFSIKQIILAFCSGRSTVREKSVVQTDEYVLRAG
jgi:hypothetical protein